MQLTFVPGVEADAVAHGGHAAVGPPNSIRVARGALPCAAWPLTTLPVAALLFAALLLLGTGPASGQTVPVPGTVAGRVLEANSGRPLAFTNVILVGTTQGAIAREDGTFTIENVKPGHYDVQASFMGYTTASAPVDVQSRQTATVEIRLKQTTAATLEEVEVTAERPLVDPEIAATVRSVNADEIKHLTIQPTLESVVEQQPGVTRDRDKIHIRGGRSDETLYVIEGVQMRDLLSGESQGGDAISARSVAEVNVITGGFDAKYGQALSGIVEAKLKEGSADAYHGYLGYTTDALTDDWNVDQMDFQIGGPVPLLPAILRPIGGTGAGRPTFFLNLATELESGYLPSVDDLPGTELRSGYRDSFLGKSFRYEDFFYPRGNNDWRLLFKSAWQAHVNHKFSVSYTKNLSFDQGFSDQDIADINRNTNNYPWIWSRHLDRYYTVSDDQNTFSFSWNHTLRQGLNQQVKLTRYFTSRHQDVAGQLWNEYNTVTDNSLLEEYDTPYFIDVGDATSYRDRYIKTWALDWDWIHFWKQHEFRWGLHSQYEDVQYLTIDASSIDDRNPLGDEFDLFHVYPNTGALYLQDRLEFEGLIANVGLRYDYWFPGEQVLRLYDAAVADSVTRPVPPTINAATRAEYLDDTSSLFGYRYKGHLAPRVQVSHPIGQHSNLFFNYGHFSQRPAYFYVYAKSNAQSSEEFPRIGNPNLNPEVSVQYEIGVGHQFTDDKAVKVVVYNKDIYDYPTSTTLVLQDRGTRRADFFVYRNLDYARSRGIELELRKRRTDHLSWAVSYTYSNAKGKSSDPNNLSLVRETGGDARETALEEEYMWWNRPHKVTGWFTYAIDRGDDPVTVLGVTLPHDLRFNAYFLVQSGRAYTPEDTFGNFVGVFNSKNGPFDSTVNATLVKGFALGGRRFEITLQGWNLLNHRNPIDFDPVTGEGWKPGEGALGVNPLDDPDNLSLSDVQLAEVAGVELDVNEDDPRLDGLDPRTPEYDAVYEMLEAEAAALVAPGLRRQIEATVNQYSDPSLRVAPRHFRLGIGMEW